MNRRIVVGLGLSVLVATGPMSAPLHAAGQAKTYKNCTALNKVYKHGVGKPGARDKTTSRYKVTNFTRSTALYNANKSKDRDGDGIACEKR